MDNKNRHSGPFRSKNSIRSFANNRITSNHTKKRQSNTNQNHRRICKNCGRPRPLKEIQNDKSKSNLHQEVNNNNPNLRSNIFNKHDMNSLPYISLNEFSNVESNYNDHCFDNIYGMDDQNNILMKNLSHSLNHRNNLHSQSFLCSAQSLMRFIESNSMHVSNLQLMPIKILSNESKDYLYYSSKTFDNLSTLKSGFLKVLDFDIDFDIRQLGVLIGQALSNCNLIDPLNSRCYNSSNENEKKQMKSYEQKGKTFSDQNQNSSLNNAINKSCKKKDKVDNEVIVTDIKVNDLPDSNESSIKNKEKVIQSLNNTTHEQFNPDIEFPQLSSLFNKKKIHETKKDQDYIDNMQNNEFIDDFYQNSNQDNSNTQIKNEIKMESQNSPYHDINKDLYNFDTTPNNYSFDQNNYNNVIEDQNNKLLYLVYLCIPNRIFVGGINSSIDEEILGKFFCQFGKIIEINIVRDFDKLNRGFGFITFESREIADQILHEYYGSIMIDRRPLNIGPAMKRLPFIVEQETLVELVKMMRK